MASAPSEGADEATTAGEGAGSSPLAGLNKGAMAALLVRAKPLDVPAIEFVDGDGATKSLADFKGKVVLLNIWASWCVPCREEMPALDKLETELGDKHFAVVAVNIDKGGPDKARAFLAETGATHLPLYTEPSSKLFAALKAVGMPTTLVLDRDGREIGRLVGPADWSSPEAKRVIEAAIAAKPAGAS
jgi:thiol-disulfide isomerase/thioredoxin